MLFTDHSNIHSPPGHVCQCLRNLENHNPLFDHHSPTEKPSLSRSTCALSSGGAAICPRAFRLSFLVHYSELHKDVCHVHLLGTSDRDLPRKGKLPYGLSSILVKSDSVHRSELSYYPLHCGDEPESGEFDRHDEGYFGDHKRATTAGAHSACR